MSGRRAIRWTAVLTTLAVTGVPGPGATAAGELPRCRVVDFSPAFDRDGTAFCAAVTVAPNATDFGRLRLYRSTNKGRTWELRPAGGLDRLPNGGNGENVEQLVVSPRFAQDHQIAVQLSTSGVWLSRDGGDSFLPADPAARPPTAVSMGPPSLVGYEDVLAAPPAGPASPLEPAAVFAYAGAVPSRIVDGVRVPVVAVADGIRPAQFLVDPPTGPAKQRFVVGTSVAGVTYQTHLYGCDANLVCRAKLYTFPVSGVPVRVWLAPDFARSRTMVAVFWLDQGPAPIQPIHVGVMWSRDGGRSFKAMPSVTGLLDKIYDQHAHTKCSEVGIPKVALSFDRSRWYLRVSDWSVIGVICPNPPSPPAPPGDAIYESTDSGKTWRRLAFGLSPLQDGRKGSLPWAWPANPPALRGDLAVRAGRLFVVGRTNGYEGLFCSVDLGRTWAPACKR